MLKMLFAIAVLPLLISGASAQGGPGVYWPSSSRGCASWSIAGACPSVRVAKPTLSPKARQLIREIGARYRARGYVQ